MISDRSTGCDHSQFRILQTNFLLLIICILTAFTGILEAQDDGKNAMADLDQFIQESYGPDLRLINGREYFNLHTRSVGHKFLDDDKFYRGRVVIDQDTYTQKTEEVNHLLGPHNQGLFTNDQTARPNV